MWLVESDSLAIRKIFLWSEDLILLDNNKKYLRFPKFFKTQLYKYKRTQPYISYIWGIGRNQKAISELASKLVTS